MIDPTASLSTLAGRSSASGIERSQNADDQFSQEVTIEDIIRSWGESDSHADMNADGIVDVNYLLLLLEHHEESLRGLRFFRLHLVKNPTILIEKFLQVLTKMHDHINIFL